MREYRFYFREENGLIGSQPILRNFSDDASAAQFATGLSGRQVIEIWQGTELVAICSLGGAIITTGKRGES